MEINTDVLATLSFGDKVLNLKLGTYLVGNASGQYDVVLDDPSVDLKHAGLKVSPKSTKLVDFFSQHGTYIDDEKVNEVEVIELQNTAKLQFGNVVCQYRSLESDSGFLGLSHSSVKDTSIIPNSPGDNKYEFQTSRLRIQDKTKKSTTSTPTMLAAQFFSESAIGSENIFENITDLSVQRNCFALDDDDDFFIAETQEALKKLESEHDSCGLFQLSTQDFNGINETSTDSDNIIADVSYAESMHIPYIKPSQTAQQQNSEKLEENRRNILKRIEYDGDNSDETDCEEEMLILKWNASTMSNKVNGEICKSASVTPDINFPDADKVVSEDEDCLDPTQAFILPKPSASDECLIRESEDEDEICLDPTEAFILPKVSASDESLIREAEDEFLNLPTTESFFSKPVLENEITNSTATNQTENLDNTEIFVRPAPRQPSTTIINHSFSVPSIDQFNKMKSNLAKDSTLVEEDDTDMLPTQAFIPENRQSIVTNVSVLDKVEKDESLELTQVFIVKNPTHRPITYSPIIFESDEEENNSEFCSRETLVIGEEATLSCSRNNKESLENKKPINKLFGSSDEEEDDSSDLNRNNLLPKTPTSARKLQIQPTPDFTFKLPNLNKINAADEIFQIASKKLRPHKTTLEESSDEENEIKSIDAIDRLLNESTKPVKPTIIENAKKILGKSKKPTKLKRAVRKTAAPTSSDEEYDIEWIEATDRLLNESTKPMKPTTTENAKKISEKSIKPTKSKRAVRKTAAPSFAANLQEEDSKKKVRFRKVETTDKNSTTRTSSRIKTIPGSLFDCANAEETILTKDFSSKENSVHQSTRHQRQQQLIQNLSDADVQSNASSSKNVVDEPGDLNNKLDFRIKLRNCGILLHKVVNENITEPSEKKLTNKRRNQTSNKDEIDVPKKRSKENVPTITKPHQSSENPVVRKSSRQPKSRIAFTKMDSKPYMKDVEKIGACIVENPADCNVLITDTIYRTWKFMAAVAKGIPIVSVKWLLDAAAGRNTEMSYDDYLIKDTRAERRFKFTLRKSLDRARKSPLFKGYTFYCTPNTKPTPKELYTIIECAGGNVIKKIPKDFQKPENFYVISDKTDISSWLKLRKVIRDVTIISTEGVLTTVIQQYIIFKSYLLS